MKRAMVVALMTTLVVVGSMGPAFTHTANLKSNVRMSVSDNTPKRGNAVTFKGKIKAHNVKCRKFRKVRLIRNTHVMARGHTNKQGIVRFRKPVRVRGTFWLVAVRKVLTLAHPHEHICGRRVSNRIIIRPHP